jgi:hypothetical protein
MKPKCPTILAAMMATGMSGSAAVAGDKVSLAQTPDAVRQAIERELVGAQLEDIARTQRQGETIYETDIVRDGRKWEVLIAGDGRVVSRKQEGQAPPAVWREKFDVNKADLAPTGSNPYLTIQPGKVLKLAHGGDRLTVSILDDTHTVDGVTTGVLEEREEKDGQLIEVSRNFFATQRHTGDVYYFGEDVDNYKDGKVVGHESAWLAGEKGARFGLMIPGKPKVGDRFYQELAPRVALDRVEIVSVDETVETPAGTFHHCMHLRETTPLESGVSHKYYAPGVGMIKDDKFELVQKP